MVFVSQFVAHFFVCEEVFCENKPSCMLLNTPSSSDMKFETVRMFTPMTIPGVHDLIQSQPNDSVQ